MSRVKAPKAALLASADDVEARFYEALQQGDIAAMMAVWADDDEIVCVHPGGGRVVGAAAIRASFEAIFANGGVPAAPEQVHRLQSLGVAVHHLVERVVLPPGQGTAEAWVLATNVYVNTTQGWRLVAHHASPGAAEAPAAATEWPSTLH
ncbi:MAG: SgcJ/EcaC family oxidoreductase [Rubrivivax sp.]